MNCSICRKPTPDHDHYFAMVDVANKSRVGVNNKPITICESCAAVTTITDMYMSGHIRMGNSEDDSIESTAVVSDPIDVPEKQVFATMYGVVSENPVDVVYAELHDNQNPVSE